MLIPKLIEAADLCITRASIILMVEARSSVNPRAIPSNNAWVESAIKSTKL
jgi:hypothetical protein